MCAPGAIKKLITTPCGECTLNILTCTHKMNPSSQPPPQKKNAECIELHYCGNKTIVGTHLFSKHNTYHICLLAVHPAHHCWHYWHTTESARFREQPHQPLKLTATHQSRHKSQLSKHTLLCPHL